MECVIGRDRMKQKISITIERDTIRKVEEFVKVVLFVIKVI